MKLTARFIPLVAPFRSSGDIRYYLDGICVRPHPEGGALVAATNGHILGVVYDRDAEIENEVILRLDKRTVAACGKYKGIENRTLEIRNDRLVVIDPEEKDEVHIQAGNPIIEATYPQYRNIIPDADQLKPGLVGTVHDNYMAMISSVSIAARKMGFGRYTSFEFFNINGDRNKSAIFRLTCVPEFIDIVMPVRNDIITDPLPTWLSVIPKVEEGLRAVTA